MSEQQTTQTEQDAAADAPASYDAVAAQDRWRKVWEEMDPFRADTKHELSFVRYGPRLLEQQVRIPLCGITHKEG